MPAYDHAFDWVRRHVDAGVLPTAVLGIATAEGVVALDAFGGASVDDHYPLFSVTKPMVGLSALQLIEQGRLTAETPLARAVPEFGADRDDVVRLRHLVSHTSGIIEPPMDTPGLRSLLVAPGRDFAAGTVSRYSTIAFEGVAALIEHAGGTPWGQAVAAVGERVGATGFTLDAEASHHEVVDAAGQGLDYEKFASLRHPGAGLLGRAEDLLAVGSALLRNDGSIVSPVTVEAMLRPLTAGLPKLEPYRESRGQDWGFTWNLRHSAQGLLARDTYGHGGWAGAEFWITPSRDVCFVLLTNIGGGFTRLGADADELHNAVAAA
ncbi:serine hydrolase domain-containing protein [Agromyces ramosus]|uniref:CubicO group peptidase (Beta-lactamase class C family) n=1 Tax=Agromyces ramosus TaxID=33879 RepID=A0ABU0R8F3_9MICO|nr:serine hydrolase domain-containing protein [Agromyces ramosus]MDQ0894362.1 CubicO group peptidase (beta-lactamase class C family) [Agromyces ramosus]